MDIGSINQAIETVMLAKWSRSPAAIGDGRPGPCSHNGELIKLGACRRNANHVRVRLRIMQAS
jgi:hypothetical protein